MLPCIGLTGPAGCGKDTVAAILAEYGYSTYAFAKPLKEMLSVVGLVEPATRDEKEANYPGFNFSYRDATQKLGTEGARALDSNFWIQVAENRTAGQGPTVFTDVRFENEAAFIHSKGGVVFHILGRSANLLGATATHSSENGVMLRTGDITIDNSGTLAVLRKNISDAMSKLSAE